MPEFVGLDAEQEGLLHVKYVSLVCEVMDAEKIKELYRWVYSREPGADELGIALAHITKNEANKKLAYEDIIWALINTKEFLFNH